MKWKLGYFYSVALSERHDADALAEAMARRMLAQPLKDKVY